MKKILKGIGIGLIGLLGLVILAIAVLNITTQSRLNKVYEIPLDLPNLSSDAAAVERGKHQAAIRCVECHGANLGGSVVFSDPVIGDIVAPNIAAGVDGDGVLLSDAEFIRAIRHGVDRNGRALLVMPSKAYFFLNDQDLNDIIAYVRSLPPVEKSPAPANVTLIGRALGGAGAFGEVLSVEIVDHAAARPAAVEAGPTAEYGNYLVTTIGCQDCHGADYTGGKSPDPNAPPAPDLTRSGKWGNWTGADFIKTIRTGRTPDDRLLSPLMPWIYYGQMTDDELNAIWAYLQSLPGASVQK